MDEIKVVGARIHNLKNINVNIPKKKLILITGVSGSGKSSLAFDIIFDEGMNRYLQAMSPMLQRVLDYGCETSSCTNQK